jgi:cytochrome c peroxidase
MNRFIALMSLMIGGTLMLGFSFDEEKANSKSKADLGKLLFNETMLSLDSSVSCASCHKPEFAFADTAAFSMGIH